MADYDSLVKRLAHQFGCRDLASDTLHDMFVRLDGVSEANIVQSPRDYLFRTAINIGKNRRKAENVRASAAEIEAVLHVADESPGPVQALEARSEMEALLAVLDEMPPRRRRVFEMTFFDGHPHQEIAEMLGLTVRTVGSDLQGAVEHCAERLGRNFTGRVASRRKA